MSADEKGRDSAGDEASAQTPSWAFNLEIIQRSVVLEVLRTDHVRKWSRAELAVEVYDVPSEALNNAIERLRKGGVVRTSGEDVWASPSTRHLDELGMVCI